MVMVEKFANSPPRAFRDFACTLRGADADILAGYGCAFADIAGRVERVQRDEVARTLPTTLGRRSSALGGSIANVSGAPADISARAGWMGLLIGGKLR
jgi:hypothetical protein